MMEGCFSGKKISAVVLKRVVSEVAEGRPYAEEWCDLKYIPILDMFLSLVSFSYPPFSQCFLEMNR